MYLQFVFTDPSSSFSCKKNMLVDLFPRKIYFSDIFDFYFNENPRFRDEFQSLHNTIFSCHSSCALVHPSANRHCRLQFCCSWRHTCQHTQKSTSVLVFLVNSVSFSTLNIFFRDEIWNVITYTCCFLHPQLQTILLVN